MWVRVLEGLDTASLSLCVFPTGNTLFVAGISVQLKASGSLGSLGSLQSDPPLIKCRRAKKRTGGWLRCFPESTIDGSNPLQIPETKAHYCCGCFTATALYRWGISQWRNSLDRHTCPRKDPNKPNPTSLKTAKHRWYLAKQQQSCCQDSHDNAGNADSHHHSPPPPQT